MSYNANNPPYQQQQQQHGFPAQQNSFQQSGFPFQPAQLDPRTVFTPQQPAVSSSGQPIGNDPFNNLAASMIQQQGSNYLERGQEFVKSRMGFINSSSLHYHFNVDAEYGEDGIFQHLKSLFGCCCVKSFAALLCRKVTSSLCMALQCEISFLCCLYLF